MIEEPFSNYRTAPVAADVTKAVSSRAMSLSSRFFASIYDTVLAGTEKAGLGAHRKKLLSTAAGRVIEIGAGTGANLPFYSDAVSDLVVCEPAEPMAQRLERKLASFGRPVRVVRAPAENLPVESGSFDVAVSTLVLCTVGDPQSVLAELHRVLKPGGRLLFIEHVRAEEPGLARWQDRLNFLNKRIAQGCNCNRNTVAEIATAGFTVTNLDRDRLRKAPPDRSSPRDRRRGRSPGAREPMLDIPLPPAVMVSDLSKLRPSLFIMISPVRPSSRNVALLRGPNGWIDDSGSNGARLLWQ